MLMLLISDESIIAHVTSYVNSFLESGERSPPGGSPNLLTLRARANAPDPKAEGFSRSEDQASSSRMVISPSM